MFLKPKGPLFSFLCVATNRAITYCTCTMSWNENRSGSAIAKDCHAMHRFYNPNIISGVRLFKSGWDQLPPWSRNSDYDSIKSTRLAYSPQNGHPSTEYSPLRSTIIDARSDLNGPPAPATLRTPRPSPTESTHAGSSLTTISPPMSVRMSIENQLSRLIMFPLCR